MAKNNSFWNQWSNKLGIANSIGKSMTNRPSKNYSQFMVSIILLISCNGHGQDTIIKLWPKTIPNQIESKETEIRENSDFLAIFNVQDPTIEVYLPSKKNATGRAAVIFPGGSYMGLAFGWEGVDIAKALNSRGISAFVVKYRLPISKSLTEQKVVPLQDAQRAIRLVKDLGELFHIDSTKVGIIGFSAGGHLASTLGTHFLEEVYQKTDACDYLSARPAFMALVYPVISMKDSLTHKESKNALLGEMQYDAIQINRFSNELHVTKDTPPTFLIHTVDDGAVKVENSISFFKALKKQKVPVEMHIYPLGGHGFGLALKDEHLSGWIEDLIKWIEDYF